MKKEYDFSRGRRGPVISTQGKTRITIYIDDQVHAAFKAESARTGTGYQTLIHHLSSFRQPLRPVISSPNFISFGVCQLKFNDIWRQPSLIEKRARHCAEAMAGHLILRVPESP